jgi:hypothetical protein
MRNTAAHGGSWFDLPQGTRCVAVNIGTPIGERSVSAQRARNSPAQKGRVGPQLSILISRRREPGSEAD